jgi:hypothetical protein
VKIWGTGGPWYKMEKSGHLQHPGYFTLRDNGSRYPLVSGRVGPRDAVGIVANEKSLSLPEIESHSLETISNIITFKPCKIMYGSTEIVGWFKRWMVDSGPVFILVPVESAKTY